MSHGPRTGRESWGPRFVRCPDGGQAVGVSLCSMQPASLAQPASKSCTQARGTEQRKGRVDDLPQKLTVRQRRQSPEELIAMTADEAASLENELGPADITAPCTPCFLDLVSGLSRCLRATPLGSHPGVSPLGFHLCLLDAHVLTALNWSLCSGLGAVAVPRPESASACPD